jgi:hypothetical protein
MRPGWRDTPIGGEADSRLATQQIMRPGMHPPRKLPPHTVSAGRNDALKRTKSALRGADDDNGNYSGTDQARGKGFTVLYYSCTNLSWPE